MKRRRELLMVQRAYDRRSQLPDDLVAEAGRPGPGSKDAEELFQAFVSASRAMAELASQADLAYRDGPGLSDAEARGAILAGRKRLRALALEAAAFVVIAGSGLELSRQILQLVDQAVAALLAWA